MKSNFFKKEIENQNLLRVTCSSVLTFAKFLVFPVLFPGERGERGRAGGWGWAAAAGCALVSGLGSVCALRAYVLFIPPLGRHWDGCTGGSAVLVCLSRLRLRFLPGAELVDRRRHGEGALIDSARFLLRQQAGSGQVRGAGPSDALGTTNQRP